MNKKMILKRAISLDKSFLNPGPNQARSIATVGRVRAPEGRVGLPQARFWLGGGCALRCIPCHTPGRKKRMILNRLDLI